MQERAAESAAPACYYNLTNCLTKRGRLAQGGREAQRKGRRALTRSSLSRGLCSQNIGHGICNAISRYTKKGMQAYPRAETKWRRDDAALPGARVSHNHLEGKHVVEIRCVDISTIISTISTLSTGGPGSRTRACTPVRRAMRWGRCSRCWTCRTVSPCPPSRRRRRTG